MILRLRGGWLVVKRIVELLVVFKIVLRIFNIDFGCFKKFMFFVELNFKNIGWLFLFLDLLNLCFERKWFSFIGGL